MEIKYKGFELSSASLHLTDFDSWTPSVSIMKHHDARHETLECTYRASNTFKTKEEADKHSINYGKEIIDGKHQSVSIEGLL